jgi:predicted GNAT family acetyltransferase
MDDAVLDNVERSQFEILQDGHVARLKYRLSGDVLELIHTEVPSALEGRGFGSRLAKHALDYAAENSFLVKPTCPFVRGFIDRHREYARLTRRE